MAQVQPKVFAFVFPMAAGHINPSLPIARALVELGHEVHYLCREQMRTAIEDTGAKFHSDVEAQPELYEGREPDLWGALESLKKEFGLENVSLVEATFQLTHVQLEMMLPGVLRWLRRLGAEAVAYCPMMKMEAAHAARVLSIPSVALLTLAGPGSAPPAFSEFLAMCRTTEEKLRDIALNYPPRLEAVARLNAQYGLEIPMLENMQPCLGKYDILQRSFVTLVTTSEDLQDPMTPELSEAYRRDGVRFEAVGPLLDRVGAKRAAGHKFKDEDADGHKADSHIDEAEVVSQVHAAKAHGRQVVLVSMGTVITGDSPEFGWEGQRTDSDGRKRGLTGRELCRAAWAGAFRAFGQDAADDGPLLVVSLGPQQDALGAVRRPANATCLPIVPQVDILKAGVDVFLTHGGQNSFTEGLSTAVPLVVCPGFGDQPINARKAEALGVGLQVPRPSPDEGCEAEAAEQYCRDVTSALERVISDSAFSVRARQCAEDLQKSGGVPRAVEEMLAAAAVGPLPQAGLGKVGEPEVANADKSHLAGA